MTADASLSRTRGIPTAGRELDALILEQVFGFERLPVDARPSPLGATHRHSTEKWHVAAAPFSTNVGSAWSVVAKVMETAWSYEARQNHESRPRFAFTAADGMGYSREGDTISHAICLAALALAAVAIPRTDDGGRE